MNQQLLLALSQFHAELQMEPDVDILSSLQKHIQL